MFTREIKLRSSSYNQARKINRIVLDFRDQSEVSSLSAAGSEICLGAFLMAYCSTYVLHERTTQIYGKTKQILAMALSHQSWSQGLAL